MSYVGTIAMQARQQESPMIPIWKVKREFKRLTLQVAQVPWLMLARRRRDAYDARKGLQIEFHQGALPLQEDVAVVLIYQPAGLQASTLHMLDHLQARGFAPVVVSNAPLAPEDRARLQKHAHLIMQRPNYGYDFGGYRDAVLHLLDSRVPIRHLLVMNDSIWFPLSDDCTLLDRARAEGKDLFGYYYNQRPKQPWRSHLQSYFFLFGPRLVASTDFQDYWRDLFVSSNKNLVIRRGEMRLTENFRSKGYSIGYCHDIASLKAALSSLSNDELKTVLRYQTIVDTANASRLTPFLNADLCDPSWRSSLEAMIADEKVGKYFLIAHPVVLFGKLKIAMLKKDRQPMYQRQRAELFAHGYGAHLSPVMRDAIESWDKP